MTQIQIDWSRVEETRRHDIATEKQAVNELNETNRHNVKVEKETNRHNRKTEKQEDKRIGETHRHNVRTEKQEDRRIRETKRHNRATEAIDRSKVSETKRHDRRTESQKEVELAIQNKKVSADIALTNAKTATQELANAVDKSDLALYKTNRFINVLKSASPAVFAYYGLEYSDQQEKKILNGVSKGQTTPDQATQVIDNLNYRKNGHHLSKEDRAAWNNLFQGIRNAILYSGVTLMNSGKMKKQAVEKYFK